MVEKIIIIIEIVEVIDMIDIVEMVITNDVTIVQIVGDQIVLATIITLVEKIEEMVIEEEVMEEMDQIMLVEKEMEEIIIEEEKIILAEIIVIKMTMEELVVVEVEMISMIIEIEIVMKTTNLFTVDMMVIIYLVFNL